ncbi:MAG TPA: hypothetical protein PK440_16245 [Candidatus Accumulibacter phosphatis]|nr:MAG: hypothetical protein AW07_01854 [Candidatus Accumulibacter sp. SK-11]HAY26741.1 hypothetical protein [Accumulibacter sp.]HCN68460.1 hypothetical protein [Accumulibacter sp.]HRL74613.1 hypothetical protein [Candidatus Accumulibacter phosphatis]HRQ96531.1 hypothetical protein [Candidatus Accumulibacter phosphatis]
MRAIERRLNKLEEIRDRNDVGSEVDRLLKIAGTNLAGLLADFDSLTAFRDWLAARTAAEERQAGVQQSIAAHHRKWQGDCAASAKWDAILYQSEV